MSVKGFVYLYHFSTPLAHARHYVGWASDVAARDKVHRAGKGGRLLAAAVAAGIEFRIVRIWADADRAFERKIKRTHRIPDYCPICRVERASARRAAWKRKKAQTMETSG